MKGLKKKYLLPKALFAIVALSGLAAFATTNQAVSRAFNFARPDVKVEMSGTTQRDSKTVILDKAEAVSTGEILEWNINSTNHGDGDAANYRVVGQVPAGTVYVIGSAKGEGEPQVTFSIDNGSNFSAEPMIDETQPDGSVKKVAAPATMYTQVMYEWAKPLASQENTNAAYRVRVK